MRTWRAFEIIKDEMVSFIRVFDKRLEINAGAMELAIIFKQIFRYSGCSVKPIAHTQQDSETY